MGSQNYSATDFSWEPQSSNLKDFIEFRPSYDNQTLTISHKGHNQRATVTFGLIGRSSSGTSGLYDFVNVDVILHYQ